LIKIYNLDNNVITILPLTEACLGVCICLEFGFNSDPDAFGVPLQICPIKPIKMK
jgi:hypothetical protein